MGDEWRKHLQTEDDGTMRIKAHGRMNVDARIVTDQNHFNNHIDDRGPEQLVNAAEIPGIVGEAWAMADWHFGYGLPIGGVIATDINHGDNGGAISPGAVGFDINCGVRVMALDATVDDIPNYRYRLWFGTILLGRSRYSNHLRSHISRNCSLVEGIGWL